MTCSPRGRRAFSLFTAGILSLSLAGTPVLTAYASPQDELADATQKLEEIGKEYQSLQEELREAAADLEIASGKIAETNEALTQAQATLSENVSGSYKTGTTSLLDVLFSANDFSDLVSRMFYLSKISQAQSQAISEVKSIQEDLEAQKAAAEEKLAETQEKVDAQAENQQRAQELVNSLSVEVRTQLEQEAEGDSSLAAGIQSAQDAENRPSGTDNSGTTNDDQSSNSSAGTDDPTADTPVTTPETPSQPSQPQQPSGGNTGGQGSTTGSSSVSSPVGYALEMEGVQYVYGGESLAEGGFDCSGLVYYAYQCIGITLPRTSDQQMAYVQQHGRFTTSISELQYGDLVFFPGHVAFYVGNNTIFGATVPGQGAGYGQIQWYGTFLGGGQI